MNVTHKGLFSLGNNPALKKDHEISNEDITISFSRGMSRMTFIVTKIRADNRLKMLAEEFENNNVIFNFTSSNKHVPEAERNNRLIKEIVS